jgi:hypothetical protein
MNSPEGRSELKQEVCMSFTEGPWQVIPAAEIHITEEVGKDLLIVSPAYIPVACCHELVGRSRDLVDMKANAALISAAPEMYSVLLKLHHLQPPGPGGGIGQEADWETFMIEARYVMAKAMGVFDTTSPASILEGHYRAIASMATVDCVVGTSRE